MDLSTLSNEELIRALAGASKSGSAPPSPPVDAAPPSPPVDPAPASNPQGMSDADLMAALKAPAAAGARAPEKPGALEDAARVAPGALYKGGMDVLGAPADILNAVDQGWQWLVSKGLEKTGVWTPEQAERARQPLSSIEQQGQYGRMGLPTSKVLVEATEKAAGPFYKPQTTTGEVAGAAVRAIPSMILGAGTVGQRAAQAVIPALTAEGAGQVARQVAPEWEGTARVVGGLGAGVATAAMQMPRGANVVMQDALQGAQPHEIEAAYRLMDDAATLPGSPNGVTLTLNDALNQVTDGRMTRLQQLDRVVTNSGGPGADRMAEVYSQRPQQVQATGQAAVNSIAPNPHHPGQSARLGQEAAQGAIDQTQAGINAMTRPAYQAAQAATVDPAAYAGLAADPLYAHVLQQVRNDPGLNRTIANLPDESVAVVDLVQRQMRQTAENLATPGQAHTNNLAAGNYGDARTAAIQAAEGATGGPTGSYATARDVQAQLRQTQLQPLNDGPVGRISRMDPAARNASAEMGRELASPGVDRYDGMVQQAVRRIVRQDPRAAETLARDYVGDVLNNATKPLQGGPNPMGGANFFKAVAGDGASMRNLQAMVTQLPQGQQRWEGFRRFLDVMQATGHKAQKGSNTAPDLLMQQQLKQGSAVGAALEAGAGAAIGAAAGGGGGGLVGAAAGARRALSDRLDQWRMAGGGDQVAWMLTSREAAPLLRELANAPAGSNRAIGLALRLSYVAERSMNQGPQAETAPIVQAR